MVSDRGAVVMTQGYGVGSHAPAHIWGAIDLAVDGDGDGSAEPGPSWGAALSAPSPPPPPDLDRAAALEQALALVGSIPQLWAANAIPRRRALLGQLLSHVYARDHRIYAIRPTRAAEPLFRAIWAEADRGTPSCSPPVGSRPILLAAA